MSHIPQFVAIEQKRTADNPQIQWSEHDNDHYRSALCSFLVSPTLEQLYEDGALLIIDNRPVTERHPVFIKTRSFPSKLWAAIQVTAGEVERWNRLGEAQIALAENIEEMSRELENIHKAQASKFGEEECNRPDRLQRHPLLQHVP